MKSITISAVALRLLLGWYMFFAGIEKVINPEWTAAGFLSTAKTFPEFYAWFALPGNAWWIDPLNAWGITLVGVALLIGVGKYIAPWTGAFLMVMYYFPHYVFPSVPHGFIVESHIIYAVAFILVSFMPEAWAFSVRNILNKTFVAKIPVIGKLI